MSIAKSLSEVVPLTIDPASINPQSSCPLYTTIPGEIRDKIFHYALNGYPIDPTHPDFIFRGKAKSGLPLLQTCRAAYRDAWHITATCAKCFNPRYRYDDQHLYFFNMVGAGVLHKPRLSCYENLRETQMGLVRLHNGGLSFNATEDVTIINPKGQSNYDKGIADLVNVVRFFKPKKLTVITRFLYGDETGDGSEFKLSFKWADSLKVSESTEVIELQFVSLQGREKALEEITKEVSQRVQIQRQDGLVFSAAGETETKGWIGSSKFEAMRLIGPEVKEDGTIGFCSRTVFLRPSATAEPREPFCAMSGDEYLVVKPADLGLELPPIACMTKAELIFVGAQWDSYKQFQDGTSKVSFEEAMSRLSAWRTRAHDYDNPSWAPTSWKDDWSEEWYTNNGWIDDATA
ncbi:hypothetical protein ABW20_dc0106278 [Dactylellina cionopaga]|nr:hypothetical protein ABW20_dc0106278 [Dactylellina cionopaga]